MSGKLQIYLFNVINVYRRPSKSVLNPAQYNPGIEPNHPIINSNKSDVSIEHEIVDSPRSGRYDIAQFELAQQYYSKSEEKTQTHENRMNEEGVTEKPYNLHISELNSKYGEEPNVVLNDTF